MPETAPADPRRLKLRKYPNRRYYDSTRSRHLTLEEIYTAIRDGYEVQVQDSKSGQDITAKVLAQIIIELDAPKLGVFPVAMLHRLLRSNEQFVGDFVDKYFNQPLTAFLDSQRGLEQYFRQAMGLHPSAPTPSQWAKAMWSPFNPALWGADRNAPQSESAAAPAPGNQEDNVELKRMIEELRKELAGLKRGRKKSTRRGGR